MLKAIFTEKSTLLAKSGKYSFEVSSGLTKYEIKNLIEKTYSVKVNSVRTINMRSLTKRTMRGKKRVISARKKAIVTLSGSGKIDIFEQKKK